MILEAIEILLTSSKSIVPNPTLRRMRFIQMMIYANIRILIFTFICSLLTIASGTSDIERDGCIPLPIWHVDNAAGFRNVSISGVRTPFTTLEALYGKGIIGDPVFR